MSDVFRFSEGPLPLLISIPHDGREIPESLQVRMSAVGLAISDTDWHVEKLYQFTQELGANTLVAKYSRYVVDLNRSDDDGSLYPGQVATGLCPERTFSGKAIYKGEGVDAKEKAIRVRDYWFPYHAKLQETLDAIRSEQGYALLWDAHSIPGEVPRLFDGVLPVLNIGSNNGKSCAASLAANVAAVAASSEYSDVLNGRFKGGHITRHYGDPQNNVHALQLEIAQRAYMDEKTTEFDTQKAGRLRDTLRALLGEFMSAAKVRERR